MGVGWRRHGQWLRERGIQSILADGAAAQALAQQGWRRDTFASRWERQYADHLRALVASGDVLAWAYEPFNLRLGTKCFYQPDFLVLPPSREIELHEVKGFWREDARVKVKVAAENHPWFRFRAVTRKDGTWVYEEF